MINTRTSRHAHGRIYSESRVDLGHDECARNQPE